MEIEQRERTWHAESDKGWPERDFVSVRYMDDGGPSSDSGEGRSELWG